MLKTFQGTSYLHHSGPSEEPVVVFIPGNPGICDYYREYIQHVHNKTGFESIVLSQLGSDIHLAESGSIPHTVHTLDDQIKHKVEFVSQLTNRRVYLCGHSIGAWMAQRVALQCPAVEFVGLLTPTLSDIAQSDRGQLLTKFKEIGGLWGISAIVQIVRVINWLPQFVLKLILGRIIPPTTTTFEATLGLVQSPAIVRQILVMGFEEMDRVGKGVEQDDIIGFWESDARKWLFYAENDHWVPARTRALTMEEVQGKKNISVQIEDVSHAFVLKDSVRVAEWTIEAFEGIRDK